MHLAGPELVTFSICYQLVGRGVFSTLELNRRSWKRRQVKSVYQQTVADVHCLCYYFHCM